MLPLFAAINNDMDFGAILIVLALAALALTAAGRYGASCKACKPKACKPKAPRRPRNGGSDSETLKSR